jgi:hypothetical protein
MYNVFMAANQNLAFAAYIWCICLIMCSEPLMLHHIIEHVGTTCHNLTVIVTDVNLQGMVSPDH